MPSDPTRNLPSGSSGGNSPRNPPVQPPSLRTSGLNADQKREAETQFEELRNLFPEEWIKNIGYLTYRKIIDNNLDLDDLSVWEEIYKDFLDEEGRFNMRMIGSDPFIDQLNHMLRLCGLTHRSWQLLVHTVVYDTSEEYKEKVDKMVFACRYQGFDPSVLLKKIIKHWRDGKRAALQEFKLYYESPEGPVEWTYNNKASLISDMTFLITIFLNRGAVIDKICKKSANDFTAVLRMLVAKYHIRANEGQDRRRRAEALGPEVITLPRISACFAQLTTNLFAAGHGRVIISTADFPNCPHVIFSPMFPSVVRKGYLRMNVMVNIHPQLMLIAILTDNTLHIRDRVTPLDQIWTYYLAAHNSGVLIDSARIEQCNKYEVTENGEFKNTLLELRDRCILRIRELRPHERIDEIINEMNNLP